VRAGGRRRAIIGRANLRRIDKEAGIEEAKDFMLIVLAPALFMHATL